MALDRQTIEKRDFPIGRRGYAREAVDAHLERIADEVDALRQPLATVAGQAASPASIARTTSEQVQEIAARSEEHAGKIRQATDQMLQRVDAMESELRGLVEALRADADRLTADLSLRETDAPIAAEEPAPAEPAVVEEPAEPEPEPEAVAVAPPAADGDVEGARLVALNMALEGTSREETGRYLAEHFDLSDREGLLDEVYATVEG